ncbi:MAG: hypothetical protein NZ899_09670 [Thermoguttaceae bacterium]|nr:hypothetical protein [Thermoguttaceae bacterium]
MGRRRTYQERKIRDYYRHQPLIRLQRVEELVSELYLAEGKKRQYLWRRVAQALAGLGVPQSRIDHLVATDNPSFLAKLVKELIDKPLPAPPEPPDPFGSLK